MLIIKEALTTKNCLARLGFKNITIFVPNKLKDIKQLITSANNGKVPVHKNQKQVILKNNKKALNFSWGSRYGLADMLNVLPDKSVVNQKSFKKLGIELRGGQFKRV